MKLVTHANASCVIVGLMASNDVWAESPTSDWVLISLCQEGRQRGGRLRILVSGCVAVIRLARLSSRASPRVRNFYRRRERSYKRRCHVNSPLRRRRLGEAIASTARAVTKRSGGASPQAVGPARVSEVRRVTRRAPIPVADYSGRLRAAKRAWRVRAQGTAHFLVLTGYACSQSSE